MSRAASKPRDLDALAPNDLEAFWMPFTANRAFKARPRLVVRAKDMHYYKPDGHAVLDGVAGMWCCNLGHNRAPVVEAIQRAAAELDRARTLINLYRDEVLPQAEANVTSALSSYRVGRVDFMTLVDAQMTLNEYRQEQYTLLAEYGSLIAELEMTIGRELPLPDTTIVEDL